MGYIAHRTVVVTGYLGQGIAIAHKKACEIFRKRLVSDIVPGTTNSSRSFFIAPDGSKEGWSNSNDSDEMRENFLDWIEGQEEIWVNFVVVRFGGDDPGLCAIERYDGERNKCGGY